MIFSQVYMCINFSPALQGGGWVEAGRGGGVEGGGKSPGEDTGPPVTLRPKGHHFSRG